MRKRIIIFSPYLRDRNELEYVVRDYLKSRKSLGDYKEIEIQKFSDIGECIRDGNKIGTGGEILVVFDSPKQESAWAGSEERIRFKSLKILLELSKKICDREGIPYIMYEGEIENGKKDILMKKLNGIDKSVLYRLGEFKKSSS